MFNFKEKSKKLHTIDVNKLGFQVQESYKTARTNIEYSIIKKGCKTVAFTSSSKSEGKTVTAVNVAHTLAQKVNTKVLIIDCDLRRPRVHSVLDIESGAGLVNYLNNECDYNEIIKSTSEDNLKAVHFGVIPPNPSELLASEAMMDFMKLMETKFDYIIVDTPPIGVVVDAVPILKFVDGVVIVIRDNFSTYPELEKTLDFLKRSGSKVLGVIINKVKPDAVGKYRIGYSGSDYYSY